MKDDEEWSQIRFMARIGIITIPRADNYGSVLQAYAIQQFVNEIEPNNELIDYVAPFLVGRYKLWNLRKDNLFVFVKSFIRNCLIYNGKKRKSKKYEEFRNLMKFSNQTIYASDRIGKYEFYITGSDQIWNTRITNSNSTFFLDFVNDSERKIAFAVSMGYANRTDDEIAFYKKMLSSIKWIGVREIQDVDFVKQCNAECNVDYIIDPTLLLPESKWHELLSKRLIDEEYILVYSFGNDDEVNEVAIRLSEQYHLPVYIIADEWKKVNSNGFINVSGVGPRDFINLIANANHVVTNSFHGTAVSVIFRKQFTVVPYKGTENRVLSLLKILNLETGIYENNICKTIDYSTVDSILQRERNKAKKFIQNVIGEGLK